MPITVEKHGDVAVITMDDGKANAAGFELLDQLSIALDGTEAGGGAVVLAGRPGLFSGGFDLTVMQGGDADAVQRLVSYGGEVALRILRLPKPVVVACTGHAYAYGALLMLAGDSRIGEQGEHRIALPETTLGMPLPPFGVEIVQQRLSRAVTTELAVYGRPFGTNEALAAGILTDLAPVGGSVEAAIAKAAELAALPTGAFAANKAAFLS